MKNKELRVEVLENGTFSQFKKDRKKRYLDGYIDEFNMMISDNELLQECERIRRSRYQQVLKIKNHIAFWITKCQRSDYSMYFATFTFTDKSLELKQYTRKQNITRLLSKYCCDYIVNIDYGKTTDREHYHAIVIFKNEDIESYLNEFNHLKLKSFDEYRLGDYDIRKIRLDNTSADKLANYLIKLVLHSVKVKQQYISVKKGSIYQKYLNLLHKLKEINKIDGFPIKEKRLKEIYKEINDLYYENTITLQRLKNVFGDNFVIIPGE